MLFRNATVFADGKFQKLDFQVEENRFSKMGENLPGEEGMDLSGRLVIPGLFDIHTHGCIGYDFSQADPGQIEKMRCFYQSNGITSVVPTTITAPLEPYRQAMEHLKAAAESGQKGSRLLGINMEGPFLSAAKKGAHDERYIIPIDEGFFEELDSLSGGRILIVDVDPDQPAALDFIRRHSGDKVISLAHTSASYETAMAAFQAGANHVTHLYNAMNGIHHRKPGMIPAVLDGTGVYAEIICDGVHVHPAVMRFTFAAMGEKLVLISDSMCACGLADGEYELGGLKVYVRGSRATLADGTIAGSVTTVYHCMVNCIRNGIAPEQAILSATLNSAKSVKMDQYLGSIAPGKWADFLVLSQDYRLEQVYQDGSRVS